MEMITGNNTRTMTTSTGSASPSADSDPSAAEVTSSSNLLVSASEKKRNAGSKDVRVNRRRPEVARSQAREGQTVLHGCHQHVFEQTLHACCLSCVTVLVHALRISDTHECTNI